MSAAAPRPGRPARYLDMANLDRIRALGSTRSVTASDRRPGVTVAILNLDRPDLIVPLIRSATAISRELAAQGLEFQMLVGDTGSTSPEVLAAYSDLPPNVQVIMGLAYQFSRSNNDLCDGRVACENLVLLNNDVHLRSASPLLAMLGCLEADAAVGAAGLVLDFPDGTLQHGGMDLVRHGPYKGLPIPAGSKKSYIHRVNSSWPAIAATGAALMVRTKLWEQLGGLDEAYEKECQDVDFCLRLARLGYSTVVVDAGPLVHEENGTRPVGEEHWADRRLFMRRWQSFIEAVYL